MKFKKGHTPWNKGLKGVYSLWPNGRVISEKQKKKMSKAKEGKNYPKLSQALKGRKAWNEGKKTGFVSKTPEKTKQKLSKKWRGIKNPNWQGGKTIESRVGIKYQKWRIKVLKRDNQTCQKCKKRKYLHVHHIGSFIDYPELRFAIDNGVTLCRKCHIEFHKKYGKINNNQEQLEKYYA